MTKQYLESDIDEIIEALPPGFFGRFSGRTVILTGARGFLGRYFTQVFVRANETVLADLRPVSVLAFDSLIASGAYGNEAVDLPNVKFQRHDVTWPYDYDDGPVDFILHAAGIASPHYYRKHPVETYRVAIVGTENMLEVAREHPGCRMLCFSSSEIYGDPDPANVPTRETYKGHVACLGPRATYDSSKRMAETIVEVHCQQYGVDASIVRPFNFYGPGMQRTDYRVLPNFAARWVDGQPLHVYGTGAQTRTFCYVTDGIAGCLQALVSGGAGEAYNIGNPTPEISMRDLALKVGRITGQNVGFSAVDHPSTYPADEPQRRCPSIEKAIVQLQYYPRVALDDGLGRFFGWANEAYRASDLAAE